MDYVLVENGQVINVGLPPVGILKNGNTVSGYNLLDHETLLGEGWLPCEESKPEYNSETHYLQFDQYIIEENKVTAQYIAVEKPKPQPTDADTILLRLKSAEEAINFLLGF